MSEAAMKHTPEPWRWLGDVLSHSSPTDCVDVLTVRGDGMPSDLEIAEADRDHIVNCVNALAGINPTAVPILRDALLELTRDVHRNCSLDFTERHSVKAAQAALVLSNALAETTGER